MRIFRIYDVVLEMAQVYGLIVSRITTTIWVLNLLIYQNNCFLLPANAYLYFCFLNGGQLANLTFDNLTNCYFSALLRNEKRNTLR